MICNKFIKVPIKSVFSPTVDFYGREIWTYNEKKNKLSIVENGAGENICC
jgi:hypothetical protein